MSQALLSVEDLAAYLQVPVATVYQWNSVGTGPRRHRIGRHVRYRQADVEAWIDKQATDSLE
jgi:excisionase family DNA binding protein